jgi:Ca2+-binding RTX toxin-like protein
VETDTASYASATAAVRADIANPGSNTGDAAGDTYIDIEALLGSRYNDTLSGLGPHLLEGGAGADSIVGGTASYVGAAGGVRADLLAPTTNTGDAAGDTYLRVRHLAGSAHDDTLGGTDAENEVHGGAGNDVIQGRGGRDFLFGGDGADQLFGGDDGDFLHGEGGDDTVSGGAGDDYLDANAGLDRFDGGAGIDTVDYFDSPWTLRADLSNPAHNAGDAEGDVYIGIENLFGGHFDDVLKGDNGPNLLVGREGDDLLIGLGGADRLRGEQGNDTIHGQGGNDYVEGGLGDDVLSGGAGGRDFFVTMLYGDDFPGDLSWGHDVITDFEDRVDVIDFRNAPNIHFSDLTITQEGLDTRIVGPADSSILLLNTSAATITAGDFLF